MPKGEQELEPEGEASGGGSGDWHSDGGEDDESDGSSGGEEVDSPLVPKGDPSIHMTQQVSVVKQLHRPDRLQSTLGRLLLCRLRRLPSSPKSRRQNLGRPCPRSKWLSPLLLGNL